MSHKSNAQKERPEDQASGLLSACSDAELWEHFRLGDKNAFDVIYDKFFHSLCCYGGNNSNNKGLVEDVVQDLFVCLWTKKKD